MRKKRVILTTAEDSLSSVVSQARFPGSAGNRGSKTHLARNASDLPNINSSVTYSTKPPFPDGKTSNQCRIDYDQKYKSESKKGFRKSSLNFNGEIILNDKTLRSCNPKDLEGDKKPPLSLIPGSVLIHLALAFKEGARKYGPYNWRTNKVQALIYLDAALRHIYAVIDGEDIDPESGKHHLDGALASLGIYIDAMETGNLIDNRPTKGVSGALIRKLGGKE